ncbi:MAG: hypothetical protein KAH20_05065 [Methylococcales bacterium]|nr:hypothetical protein [Methylococcales bacterium]
MKFTKSFNLITLSASCLLTFSIFTAPITHAKRSGKPGNHSGLIKANKHIINLRRCDNKNDKLDIKIKIPHRFKAFWNHKADAHLVAALPSDEQTGKSDFTSWNIRDLLTNKLEALGETERVHSVFKLDCDFLRTIPTGAYQFSIVMTTVNGDPTNLADWHRGFRGLLATSKIKINNGRDESDLNEDGEVDGDTDLDGLIDEKEATTPDTTEQTESAITPTF